MADGRRFLLTIAAPPDPVPWSRRLRWALKRMLRGYGLRCERIVPLTEESMPELHVIDAAPAPLDLRPAFASELARLARAVQLAQAALADCEADTLSAARALLRVRTCARRLEKVADRLRGLPKEAP